MDPKPSPILDHLTTIAFMGLNIIITRLALMMSYISMIQIIHGIEWI